MQDYNIVYIFKKLQKNEMKRLATKKTAIFVIMILSTK